MGSNTHFKAGFFLLIILGICIVASANNGDYIVTPHTGEYPESAIVDDSGADGTITYWDLPLWIQVSVITGMLFPLLAAFKFFPLLLGKVSGRLRKTHDQAICSYVEDNPGCLESEITKDLNIKRGTLRYYLDQLKSENMIFTLRKGKIKGIFHKKHSEFSQQNVLWLHLKNDTRKTVLDIIINEPGVTGKELASMLGLDKSTIHWHVSELEGDKIIDFKKEGKFKKYYFRNNLEIDHANGNMNK